MVELLTACYIMLGLFASMWIATEVQKNRPDWTPWVWSVMHLMLSFFLAMVFTSLYTYVSPVSEWNAAVPMIVVFVPIMFATGGMWFIVSKMGSARRVSVQSAPAGQTRNPAARTRAGQEALKRLEAERQRRIKEREAGAATRQAPPPRGRPVNLQQGQAPRRQPESD
ncbi:MAG: hypothetical protein Alpg2KO_02240 [Alphaproteobacteria bacterium]